MSAEKFNFFEYYIVKFGAGFWEPGKKGCILWIDTEKREMWFQYREGRSMLFRNSPYSCANAARMLMGAGYRLMLGENMPLKKTDLTSVLRVFYTEFEKQKNEEDAYENDEAHRGFADDGLPAMDPNQC